MNGAAASRREQIRAMLADLMLPGALEAEDGILSQADGGTLTIASPARAAAALSPRRASRPARS